MSNPAPTTDRPAAAGTPATVHRPLELQPAGGGRRWRGACACGWRSRGYTLERAALGDLVRHLRERRPRS